MKIRFQRTGGFAGITLRATVDSGSLPAPEVERLETLLVRSRFFELPSALETRAPGADRFQYLLTVESRGQAHTVRASERAVPDDLRPLLEWLVDRTSAGRRRP